MKGNEIVDLVIVKLEEKSAFLKPAGEGGPIVSGGDNIDELKPVYSYINAHLSEAADEIISIVPLNRLVPVDDKYRTAQIYPAESPAVWVRTAQENSDGSGIILLPADFCRLYSLKMNGWDRPVHKAITKTDHLYTLQHNRFTKGTPQKPVVSYSGNRVLLDELISSTGINALDHIVYDSNNINPQPASTYTSVAASIISDSDIFIVVLKNGRIYKYTKTGSPATWGSAVEINLSYLEYYSVIGTTHTIDEILYIPHFRNNTDYNRDVAEAIALNCAKKVLEVFGETEKATAMNAELACVLQNMQL